MATLFGTTGFAQTDKKPADARPPIVIVTDNSWDVSGQKTTFGPYPLSAGQIASYTSPLQGGTRKAVVAEFGPRSKIIPCSVPIWRNRTAEPKPTVQPPPTAATKPAAPENTVFEAGRDPGIENLRVGSILELGHVYFNADDYRLDTTSYRTLAALAAYMKRHPGLKIEVGGHTNLRPDERFANRARAVMRYLTDNGVPADRLTYKGYGKSMPRVKAVSKEADKANQRVEVKVLGK